MQMSTSRNFWSRFRVNKIVNRKLLFLVASISSFSDLSFLFPTLIKTLKTQTLHVAFQQYRLFHSPIYKAFFLKNQFVLQTFHSSNCLPNFVCVLLLLKSLLVNLVNSLNYYIMSGRSKCLYLNKTLRGQTF